MSSWGALIASISAGVTGLASGVAVGLAVGQRYGAVVWRFWVLCVFALVACSALCAAALVLAERWLAVGALGLLGGLLTGLKYGARGGFVGVAGD